MPHDVQQQVERQQRIRDLLEHERIRSQSELVRRLRARGHAVAQPSVSRDLRDLGAAKRDGVYRLPAPSVPLAPSPFDLVGQLMVSVAVAGPCLVVLKTVAGAAQPVAAAIDQSQWPEVVGSVAGDDTLFVATAGDAPRRRLIARLRLLVGKEKPHV